MRPLAVYLMLRLQKTPASIRDIDTRPHTKKKNETHQTTTRKYENDEFIYMKGFEIAKLGGYQPRHSVRNKRNQLNHNFTFNIVR